MSDSPRLLPIYVNATRVDVPPGSTAIDAVRAWDVDQADAVSRGERIITDSRGLPVPSDVAVQAGSIFRLVNTRRRGTRDSSADDVDRDEL